MAEKLINKPSFSFNYMAWYDNIHIQLNQNLWALIISYTALGLSEYYKLKILWILSGVLSLFMTIYVLFAFFWYTFKYIYKKKHD